MKPRSAAKSIKAPVEAPVSAPSSDSDSTKKRVSGLIELLVKGVAIGVPVFYAAGRLYSDAYWQQLGISATLMDRAAEDYLYFGFTALVLALARIVGLDPYATIGRVFLVAAAIGIFLAGVYLLGRFLWPWVRRIARKLDGAIRGFKAVVRNRIVQKLLGIVSLALTVAFFLLALVWLSLVLFLFVALSSREGKLQARDLQEQLFHPEIKRTSTPLPLATFIREGQRHRAPLLECSARWCIVFSDGQITAVPTDAVSEVTQRSAMPTRPDKRSSRIDDE